MTMITGSQPVYVPPTARNNSGAPPFSTADSVALSARPATNATAKRVGDVSPDEKMTVSVILKREREVALPSAPFQAVSRGQFADFAASPRQVQAVEHFASTSGLKVVESNPATHTVKLEGTAADISKAFGVEFGRFKNAAGQEYRGYTGKVQLGSLGTTADAVLGLDNRPIAAPRMVVSHTVKPHFTGPNIASLYNFPANTDGTGQTIGIIELGGGYTQGDLDEYFYRLGIKGPEVKAVSVDGAQNAPEGHANGPDGEVDLDIELAGGIAPGAKVVVYFAPNTDQGFVDAINAAAHDTENHPNILSISWGAPEKEWPAASMQAMNNALKDAAALGVNTFAAAGDNGSKDGEKDGKNHADFPASSPYAIGCGGTKLDDESGSIASEVVWRDLWGLGGSTGGGVSDVFPEPDWQKAGANVPAPTNPAGGRGVPDVAGNASPTTGYLVVTDGQEMSIGGTSAVAPLYAGLTARIQQGLGASPGWLTPTLYQHPECFHDITQGNNGGFSAGPGWDATTGLGTPDGTKLLDMLKSLKAQPAPSK